MNSTNVSRITRRAFVRNGAVASAALLGCPLPNSSHVLASEKAPGANEQIVLGIIGMGVRGTQLVINVPSSGRVAAICDADAQNSKGDEALPGAVGSLSRLSPPA